MSTESIAEIADPNAAPAPASPSPTPSPSPSPTPASPAGGDWAKGWVKDDGTFDHAVFDKAPDEYKAFKKEVERYKTVPDYLKGQKEREALLGKKGIVDPLPANATPEQQAERLTLLRKVNGAPDKPEGYGLTKPADMPAEQWDEKLAGQVAEVALKHALPPAALKDLVAVQLQANQQQVEAQKLAEKTWFDGQDKLIRENLTKEGTTYEKGLEEAQKAGRRWGVSPDSPLLKNATVFLLLNRLEKAGREAGLVQGEHDHFGVNPAMSPDKAEAAADDIMRNKANPLHKAYWDGSHPDNAKAKETWRGLRELAKKGKPDRTTSVVR